MAACIFAALAKPEDSSMACQQLEQKQMDEEKARLELQPVYAPAKTASGKVTFHFNLNRAAAGDSLFVIYSKLLQTNLYRGPYQAEVAIDIDERFARDKNFDNLEFRLLEFMPKQSCRWMNERGEPYWRPGAHVTIALLDERDLDQHGLPRNFEVAIK